MSSSPAGLWVRVSPVSAGSRSQQHSVLFLTHWTKDMICLSGLTRMHWASGRHCYSRKKLTGAPSIWRPKSWLWFSSWVAVCYCSLCYPLRMSIVGLLEASVGSWEEDSTNPACYCGKSSCGIVGKGFKFTVRSLLFLCNSNFYCPENDLK